MAYIDNSFRLKVLLWETKPRVNAPKKNNSHTYLDPSKQATGLKRLKVVVIRVVIRFFAADADPGLRAGSQH